MQPYVTNVPPTKANLKTWWNHFAFAHKLRKESEMTRADATGPFVFGKPLRESLRYAFVQISTADANGDLHVWGYIPIVVAKCGLYLKDHATEVAGTFRVNGSNKRTRDLQAKFESPPRYGKSIDWKKEAYTTHDVASVFRRYLTQMPEPVIPHAMYHQFRNALASPTRNRQEVVTIYQRLIRELPPPNRFLLLYVLDLLSVFARKCDKNLMTAGNLAVIFQPGLISHPNHEMLPGELALSQNVLEFLIVQQDSFIVDIPPSPEHPGASSRAFSEIDETIDSEDEQSGVGGSWRLVRNSIPLRPMTTENGDNHNTSTTVVLSPALEHPGGIKRSQTLPSRKKDAGHEREERNRVLRKQKHASAIPPIRGGLLEKPKS